MVHRPSRLVDIFTSMKNNHLEPKRIMACVSAYR